MYKKSYDVEESLVRGITFLWRSTCEVVVLALMSMLDPSISTSKSRAGTSQLGSNREESHRYSAR